MWSTLITFVLGFAAGCGFKEIITASKKQKTGYCKKNGRIDSSYIQSSQPSQEDNVSLGSPNMGFNLDSIAYVFSEYNVPLVDANSFANLLRAIENRTFTQTLQYFVDNASTPEMLYKLLENESSRDLVLIPRYSAKKIIIPDSLINKLLSERQLNAASNATTPEKIQLLVFFAITKGLKAFQNTTGNSLNEFLENYEKGLNVESLYEEIYGNIKDTLEFLSR